MDLKHQWQPVSSTAYGGNAVYIPEYGKARTMEFILVMTQNYPEFKTHPALDIFHGYVKGIERFNENHEMRVLGWEIKPDRQQWSFLYLPTMRNDIRATVTFSANAAGRLRMEINMDNPSPDNRQWEFHLYINPCEGLELPRFERKTFAENECSFSLNGIDMELRAMNIDFREMTETDSNFWINFPLNAECSEDPHNPQRRCKKRLKLVTKWIDVPAGEIRNAAIDFLPDGSSNGPVPDKFSFSTFAEVELPYMHALWEAYHNRQYTRDFNSNSMLVRPVPARQWGKFFIWDCGMTAVGTADFDEQYTENIIANMPDPDICGEDTFRQGSFIITAVYSLFELYRKTGKTEYIERYYALLKRLSAHMFDILPGEDYKGMAAATRGTGADDSPALFYAKGEIFSWDYQKTLPVNPDHEKKSLVCIGITAHALRILKILRIFSHLLGIEQDTAAYTARINAVEQELNEHYWSEENQCYLDRVLGEENLLDIPWIYDYLPLFSGSVPEKRQKIMFKELMREDGYFTKNGFMIVKPESPYYRRDGYPNGSAWPPLQYLFWKACYCMGEMEAAKIIAEKYFRLFEENHRETLCCWEQFRAETGKGAGNMRFSGFVTPIVAMRQAHRKYGSIQTSYDILLEKQNVARSGCELVLHSPFHSGKTGISVVLKPETSYVVSIDEKQNIEIDSDRFGWIGISLNVKKNHKYKIIIKDKKCRILN